MKKILTVIVCILFSNYSQAYDFDVNGIYYDVYSMENSEVIVVQGEKPYSGSIVIPQSVSFRGKELKVIGLGEKAFYGCSITTISMPEDIKFIDYGCFQNCKSLKSINLPSNIEIIYSCAFKNSGITEIVIPDMVATVASSAFENCVALKSITIGKSVHTLAGSCFYGCYNVETLILRDSKESLDWDIYYVEKEERWISVFGSFVNLKNLYLGRVLDMAVTSLFDAPTAPFEGCNKIEHLEIGKCVTSFRNFNVDLKTVTVYRKMPYVTENPYFGGFTNKTKLDGVLYVPKGCVDLYKEAEKWNEFWTIKEIEK